LRPPVAFSWRTQTLAPRRDALAFDLDGTLIDSAPDITLALNRLMAELGRPDLDLPEVRGMIGDGAGTLVERALIARSVVHRPEELDSYLHRFLAHYEADPIRLTRPYPGVPETLAELHAAGFRCAICTNKPQHATDMILAALDLTRFFGAILGADAVENRKPHPDHLEAALTAIGAKPGQAVMIGDSTNDVAPARALAVPSIVMAYGYGRAPLSALGADLILEDFAELPDALQRIEAER
jgi:phosphoglycolate phosphatase